MDVSTIDVRTAPPAAPTPRKVAWLVVFAGAATILVAAWIFGAIAEDVINQDAPLGALDLRVAGWLHARMTPRIAMLTFLISDVGSPVMLTLIAVVTAIVLYAKRRSLRWLPFALPGGMLLNVGVKYLVHRHRPTFADPIVVLNSYSFPSGHAMAATILYATLAAAALRYLHNKAWRAAAVAAAVVMIALVALSRMMLGVHYLSDVTAGIMEGIVWFAICLTAVSALRRSSPSVT